MEQQRAPARLIGEGFPLGATNLSLNAIPMKPFAQGIETRPKIHPMEGIGIGRTEVLVKCEARIRRTHFDIFMPFPYSQRLSLGTERSELIGIFNERLTMIGKRQRHKPVTGQPTANDAKEYGIREFSGGRGRREGNRFIPVCCLQ
jgi:hypothetical protein